MSAYPDIDAAVAVAEQQLGERGRVLLRPSGTEPVVRVMIEGEDAAEVQRLCEELAASVERLSLIHISEPTRLNSTSRMPSSA